MPITINTDLGSADANSYATLAWVTQYHADRLNAYWAAIANDELRKACLIKATDYIDKRFKLRFKGDKQFKDQSLSWPRMGAYDDAGYSYDDIPACLQKALAEYALRAAIYNVLAPDAQRLAPAQDMSSSNPNSAAENGVIAGPIRSKTEAVGPIRETTVYDSTSQVASLARAGENSRSTQSTLVNDILIPQYPEADLLLEELLQSSTSVSLVLGG